MRHFDQLVDAAGCALFEQDPRSFHRNSDRVLLAHALGATLYVPATKTDLGTSLRRQASAGAKSLVVDLEDAISDGSVDAAVRTTATTLRCLQEDPPDALLFVRVRSAGQIAVLADALGSAMDIVSGFVLPKFSLANGPELLQAVADAATRSANPLYAMPVLETPEVLYRETRERELIGLRELLAAHRDGVLSVRIGATDLCGLFGIRRDRDLSIYDVGVAAELIAHVVNHLGRTDGTGFAITGPVWEYFANH